MREIPHLGCSETDSLGEMNMANVQQGGKVALCYWLWDGETKNPEHLAHDLSGAQQTYINEVTEW